MINKGSYMYMYLFLLHKNNIRSIHVILNPTDLRQGITMAGNTFWSIGRAMMTLICTLCQWQWCNRSCADLECEGSGGGGSPLHSLHSKVTKKQAWYIPHPNPRNTEFNFYFSDPQWNIIGSVHDFHGPGLGVRWSVTFFAGAVNVLVTDSRFLGLPEGKEIRKFLMSCE